MKPNEEMKVPMGITDLNGCTIVVTDLGTAIEQAGYFKDCQHSPPVESDRKRQEYWGDIYAKVMELDRQLKDKEK